MSRSQVCPSENSFESGLSLPSLDAAESGFAQPVVRGAAVHQAPAVNNRGVVLPQKQPPAKGPDPAWLVHLLPGNKTHRQWVRTVITALGLEPNGAGLSCMFECLAVAFKAAAEPLKCPELNFAGELLAQVANVAKATSLFPLLSLAPSAAAGSLAESIAKVWSHCAGAAEEVRPAQVALSLFALEAMDSHSAMSETDVARCAIFAGACRASFGAQYSPSWRDLAALFPFEPKRLAEFTQASGRSAPNPLARRLTQVQWRDAISSLPQPVQDKVLKASSRGDDALEGDSSSGTGKTNSRAGASVDAAQPSVRGLRAAVKFAGMAEHFGVMLVLNRLPPHRLIPITKACHAALRAGEGRQSDQAVLVAMALIISHDFKSTLKLPLVQDATADLWYSLEDRCVYFDRNALLGKAAGALRSARGKLFVPPEVADRIGLLASRHGTSKRLCDLFTGIDCAELCRDAERWTKSLSDPAHSGWSARVAHSLGLAYLHVGAGEVEAAALSLNLPLAVLAAQNYYQPAPERQLELTTKLFQALGFESPVQGAHDDHCANSQAPSDQDMRREWAQVVSQFQRARDGLPGACLSDAIALFNAFMVTACRAETLLTGARDQRRENPRLKDVLVSGDWCFRSDKNTKPSSDRLLPMSPELADLVRAVCWIRDVARNRLLQLGFELHRLPPHLVAPNGGSSLFMFLVLRQHADGGVISSRSLCDADLEIVPQLWAGPFNMGRRYWVREASQSCEWMIERVLTGHAQGLNHAGTACLAMPVMDLLQGAKRLTQLTLQRLNLPRLCLGLDCKSVMPALVTDLRRYEQRKHKASVSTDLPIHYCDHQTLGAVRIVDALRPYVGRASQLSAAGRVLLSLVVASGLCHTVDLEPAWRALMNAAQCGSHSFLRWDRPSGQPIAMPLLPPTRIALAEVNRWPDFIDVEAELAKWIISSQAIVGVIWPKHPRAVMAALCAQMARWVRLHVPPFLVEAYRPEVLAATISTGSLDQFLGPLQQTQLQPLGRTESTFRKLKDVLTATPSVEEQTARIQSRLGRFVNSTTQDGESRARARHVLRDAHLSAWRETTDSGVAKWLLTWIFKECELTYVRHKRALDPGTIYDYLSLVRPTLKSHWPADWDPELVSPEQWRTFAQRINAGLQLEEEGLRESRKKAWRRIFKTLAEVPLYAGCTFALDLIDGNQRTGRYVPSAASTIITSALVEQLHVAIDRYFTGEPLACQQAHAMLNLLAVVGLRMSEACAPSHNDLAVDGTFLFKAGNGFDRIKTRRSSGPTAISSSVGAQMLALKQIQQQLHPPQRFFFAEAEDGVDIAHALAIYAVVVKLTKETLGAEAVHGHSHRGSAAMRQLAPGWESRLGSISKAPFELRHALEVMEAMRGSGVAHMATVLNGLGHASHRTFVRRYCTAWPLFYACAMRASLNGVELDSSLIYLMPHLQGDKAAIERAMACRRSFVYSSPQGEPRDDWTWAIRHHYENWRRELRGEAELSAAAPKARLNQAASKPAPQLARHVEVQYLLLLGLGLTSMAAMQKLQIGLADGGRLNSIMHRLPTLGALSGARKPKEIKGKFKAFMLRVFGEAACEALIAAISSAKQSTLIALSGQLADRAGAPEVTAHGLRALLKTLPTQFAIELAMVEGHWLPELQGAIAGERRIRIKPLVKRKSRRPRVRICLDDSGRIAHNITGALTLIARFCAAATQEILLVEEEQ